MSAETVSPPESEMELGRRLVRIERNRILFEQLQIGIVAVVLVILLFLALLQMKFDPSKIATHFAYVFEGAWTTIYVSLISIAIASVFALIGALGRLSKNAIFSGAAALYVSVVRGTPLLVQIFLIYFGLPRLREPLTAVLHVPPDVAKALLVLPAIPVGILALSFNYGAYMTEIFRAGIQSISHGQREAAQAIGMSPWQTTWRIVLPQAFRVILPDVGNQFIAMQKDSSLIYFIGVAEILWRTDRIARTDGSYIEMYLLAALLYWTLTIISSWGQRWLENRMAHAYER